MPGVYAAHLHTLEVREKKPKGLIELFIHSVDPGSHFPAGSFQTFKLDEDSKVLPEWLRYTQLRPA
jgi:hypothetical protein